MKPPFYKDDKMEEQSWNKYRVWLHSKPSPGWTYYEGYVDVFAEDDEDAFYRARRKLKYTSFPERGMDSWTLEKVEEIN